MPAEFGSADFEIIERRDLYKRYFRAEHIVFRHKKFAGGWSEPVTREVFMTKGAASVLLYDATLDALVFVEQFRIGASSSERTPWQLEMVAGMLDKDISAQDIARNEAMEEAGCVVNDLVFIGAFYTTPGICNEKFHVYAAKVDASQLAAQGGLADEHEDIRIHVVPRATAFAWLDEGRIENAMTVLALQWLRIKGINW